MITDCLVWIDGPIPGSACTGRPGWYVEINHVSQGMRRHAFLGNDYETHTSRWFFWKKAEESYAVMFANAGECIFSYLIGTDDKISRRVLSVSPLGVFGRGEIY